MIRSLALLAAAAAAASAPQPMAYPSFPPSRAFSVAAGWLEREANIPRRDLVAVQDGVAWALAASAGASGAGLPVAMHLEALDPVAAEALGGRSAMALLDTDCAARQASLRSADLYAASNLLGEARKGLGSADLTISREALAAVAIGLCARPAGPGR